MARDKLTRLVNFGISFYDVEEDIDEEDRKAAKKWRDRELRKTLAKPDRNRRRQNKARREQKGTKDE